MSVNCNFVWESLVELVVNYDVLFVVLEPFIVLELLELLVMDEDSTLSYAKVPNIKHEHNKAVAFIYIIKMNDNTTL